MIALSAAICGFSFFTALGITCLLVKQGSRIAVLDQPNDRSLHREPVPRGGGISFLACIISAYVLLSIGADQHVTIIVMAILGGLLPVSFISYLDDRYGVPFVYRLVVQFFAASLAIGLMFQARLPQLLAENGFSLNLVGIGVILLFALIWMINLYNFMDGIDGFAAGMAVIGFLFFAYFGWAASSDVFTVFSLIIVSSCLGFLVYNFPPAKIFMGDVGSASLGFLAGIFSLWGIRDDIFSVWIPLFVFGPFVVDASVTLMRRLLRGEKIWQAHRSHYYQRMVLLGFGHRKTVLVEYLIMLLSGATAILLNKNPGDLPLALAVIFWSIVGLAAGTGITYLEKREAFS